MKEFDLINRVFAPLASEGEPAYGLKNDTAILTPPAGRDLVFTKDVMIEDVHFPAGASAYDIARKLMRVNLSDLATAGAVPMGYMLGIAATGREDDAWFTHFANGLRDDQLEFGLSLWGGDTTSGAKSLCLSLTAIGHVPKGKGLKRTGAKAGDGLYVTGHIGDAALGLKALQSTLKNEVFEKNKEYLIHHYWAPTPRFSIGQGLLGIASAAIDVSDGLLADVGHIAEASGLKAVVCSKYVPLSAVAKKCVEHDSSLFEDILTGGDDYELVFSAPKGMEKRILDLGWRVGVLITRIGHLEKGKGLSLLDLSGKAMTMTKMGYEHSMNKMGIT